jgi:hypothetical protein
MEKETAVEVARIAISRKREAEMSRTDPGRIKNEVEHYFMQTTLTPAIRTYAELQEQLHRDLLAQHPEWIEPNGECPKCDNYDRRFAELISFFRTGNLNSIQDAA